MINKRIAFLSLNLVSIITASENKTEESYFNKGLNFLEENKGKISAATTAISIGTWIVTNIKPIFYTGIAIGASFGIWKGYEYFNKSKSEEKQEEEKSEEKNN